MNGKRPKDSRVWMLAVCAAIFVAVVASLAVADRPFAAWPVIVLAGAFVAVLAVIYARLTVDDLTEPAVRAYGDMMLAPVATVELDAFVSRDGLQSMDYPQLFSFIDPLFDPESVFTRISETVESAHRSIVLRSAFSVALGFSVQQAMQPAGNPSATAATRLSAARRVRLAAARGSNDYVIPLITPARGGLLDGVRAFDDRGTEISTLSAQNLLVYSLAVMRGVVVAGTQHGFDAYVASLEPELYRLLRRPDAATDAEIASIVEQFDELGSRNASVIVVAKALAKALLKVHLICVCVPVASVRERSWPVSMRFVIERRFVPDIGDAPAPAGESRVGQALDSLRLALGVRLNRVYVPLFNAGRTHSYHLEVIGPEGTYLAAQDLIAGGDTKTIDARLQARRGQRRAHVYIRRLSTSDGAYFAAQFSERSPGSFVSATLSSLAAAVVISVLAVREIEGVGVGQTNLSMTSALLAVPIGVAALSGFDASRNVRHPSLLSRVLTLLTVASSLTALLIVSIPRTDSETPDTAWVILVIVAWSACAVSGFSLVMRTAVERRLALEFGQDNGGRAEKGP